LAVAAVWIGKKVESRKKLRRGMDPPRELGRDLSCLLELVVVAEMLDRELVVNVERQRELT